MNTKNIQDSKQDMATNMTSVEWALIVFLSILWGSSFFFTGVAVKELPPFTIVFSRVALAACLLFVLMRLKKLRFPSSPKIWISFLVMGMLNNVIPFSLISWGQGHIASGLASILTATTPIFSIILAHFVIKEERLTLNRIVGVMLGWIGVVTLIGFKSLEGVENQFAGQCSVLGAAFFYACAAIYGRRFKGIPFLVTTTGMLCGSTILMAPLAVVIDTPWVYSVNTSTVLALIGLASLSTALAYIIYFRILTTAGPTNVLLVTFLLPVSAIVLGSVFLDERLHWNAFTGMGIIFFGLLFIDGRMFKRLRNKRCGIVRSKL